MSTGNSTSQPLSYYCLEERDMCVALQLCPDTMYMIPVRRMNHMQEYGDVRYTIAPAINSA